MGDEERAERKPEALGDGRSSHGKAQRTGSEHRSLEGTGQKEV